MKKRVFSLILAAAVAVLNLSLLLAVSAATVTNYWDVNFDDGAWTNHAESGKGFGANHNGAGANAQIAEDEIRESNALKVEMPKNENTSLLYRIGLENANIPGRTTGVTWYEVSFKFEGAITPWNPQFGSAFFSVTTDGGLYVGGVKGVGAFPNAQAEGVSIKLNEWYHIVVATDFADQESGKAKLYAWLNGEMIKTAAYAGKDYTMLWSPNMASMIDTNHLRMVFNPNPDENSVFWIDNLKIYQSDTAVKDTAYDPTDIFDGAELTSESLLIQNNVIYADGGQTLADVDALLIKPASGVTYFDGNTPVSDMNEAAVGKTVYARSIGGVGVMKYTIAEKTDFMVAKEYYDINFDDGAWTNQADSGMIYGYDTKVGVAAAAQEVTTEPVRENKALKISLPTGASNELYRLAKKSGETVSGLGQYATWYEMSFKFDGAVLDTAFQPSAYIFNVTPDGTVYLGGKYNFSSNNGTPVNNFKCKTDEWYHFVAAVDYVNTFTNDAGNTYARFYAWINGKLLTTANSGDCTMYWSNATVDVLKKDAIDVARLTIVPNAEKTGAFWMDNFKVYTTYNAVATADGALCFDPMAVMSGTEVTSNTYRVADGAVYIPADATLAQVQQNLDISGTAVYMKGNTVAGDGAAAAAGVDIHVRAANGIGVKKYSLTESTGLERISAEWMKNGSTPAASASEFTTGDSAVVSLRLANNTAEQKDMILVTAAYCKERLSGCKITDVSLAAGEVKTVTSDALAVSESEGLTLKAFLWDSVQTLQAETDAVILR